MKTIAFLTIAIVISSAVQAVEEYTPAIEKTIPIDIADPTPHLA
jgi:hypothetical protein